MGHILSVYIYMIWLWEFIEITREFYDLPLICFKAIWLVSDPVCLRTRFLLNWSQRREPRLICNYFFTFHLRVCFIEYTTKSVCLLIVRGHVKMVIWFIFPFCIDSMKCPFWLQNLLFLPFCIDSCFVICFLAYSSFDARRKSSLLLYSPSPPFSWIF